MKDTISMKVIEHRSWSVYCVECGTPCDVDDHESWNGKRVNNKTMAALAFKARGWTLARSHGGWRCPEHRAPKNKGI